MSPQLTAIQKRIVGVVVAGVVVIAGIGFAGSYAAVRELALAKGFGWFANVFPIGIDAGIIVLLALDLLLTWLRIPFPLIRHTAWLLTAATIAFNGAAAWPDPIAVGMHGIIPILFVVSVEAARHAIGRIADITADRHMESVRLARWLLAPWPTFRLWRRMKLWELRSYVEVIELEKSRLVYQARLRAQYGRAWRHKAPVEALMPLRLARYGHALRQAPSAVEPSDEPAPAPAAAAAPALAAASSPSAAPALPPLPKGYEPAPTAAASGAAPVPATPSVAPSRNTATDPAAPRPAVLICGGPTEALTLAVPSAISPGPATQPPVAPHKPPALRTAAPPLRPARAVPEPEQMAATVAAQHPAADPLAGRTKASAIRSIRKAEPTATPAQIVELLAAQHITATPEAVRAVLSRDRKRRRNTQTGTTGFYP